VQAEVESSLLDVEPPKPVTDQSDFAVRVETASTGEAVVSVIGEVDLSNGPELEHALLEAAKARRLVVDLSGCTFLSSTGLRALLEVDRARGKGAEPIVVVVSDPHVRKVFEIAGVESLFALVDRYDAPGLDAGRAVS
jgi:anti-anti-sigma factor